MGDYQKMRLDYLTNQSNLWKLRKNQVCSFEMACAYQALKINEKSGWCELGKKKRSNYSQIMDLPERETK